ncbi:hypothetical protein [Thermogemmatispora tikiterensis]|uniref:Uncharacterized protein n=1 Tax=Thermogemmatispora tikiterensis TaxID=1825093 RepID=A0A328VIE7_9CHLR|nr:hypothetical protein [Thermogemmatispora tikiterensis]RAQ95872.1 hypothetical protein A4R35_10015 [Thermogemmatispora tikiterensis]
MHPWLVTSQVHPQPLLGLTCLWICQRLPQRTPHFDPGKRSLSADCKGHQARLRVDDGLDQAFVDHQLYELVRGDPDALLLKSLTSCGSEQKHPRRQHSSLLGAGPDSVVIQAHLAIGHCGSCPFNQQRIPQRQPRTGPLRGKGNWYPAFQVTGTCRRRRERLRGYPGWRSRDHR